MQLQELHNCVLAEVVLTDSSAVAASGRRPLQLDPRQAARTASLGSWDKRICALVPLPGAAQ